MWWAQKGGESRSSEADYSWCFLMTFSEYSFWISTVLLFNPPHFPHTTKPHGGGKLSGSVWVKRKSSMNFFGSCPNNLFAVFICSNLYYMSWPIKRFGTGASVQERGLLVCQGTLQWNPSLSLGRISSDSHVNNHFGRKMLISPPTDWLTDWVTLAFPHESRTPRLECHTEADAGYAPGRHWISIIHSALFTSSALIQLPYSFLRKDYRKERVS